MKEIKYVRQSLEHRLIYYQSKPQYSQYADELKPIIKKFKDEEGLKCKSITSLSHVKVSMINQTERKGNPLHLNKVSLV